MDERWGEFLCIDLSFQNWFAIKKYSESMSTEPTAHCMLLLCLLDPGMYIDPKTSAGLKTNLMTHLHRYLCRTFWKFPGLQQIAQMLLESSMCFYTLIF
jgi:hypothetical protein